jgi:putative ABC transport system permease protein
VFRNYLITALRNLVRHKLYSFINIAGLALGLASVILIALFIRDEISFDKWVPDSANLYRLDESFMLPGRAPVTTPLADFPLPALLRDSLPEVTGMTRLSPFSKTVTVGGRTFSQNIVGVDSDFFRIIRFPLAAGDPATVLTHPDSIVLSQTVARKLFGNTDPLGKTLTVNRTDCETYAVSCANTAVTLRVTGVMRDLPHNTHVRVEAVIPHISPADALTEKGKRSYYNINGYGYVRLAPGSDPAVAAAKIGPLLDKHVDVMQELGMKLQASKTISVTLVPFGKVHLDEAADTYNMVPAGNRVTLYGLGLIGLLILLIACFNFTNLATARAAMRAREIALRKCVGARRSQLVGQFLFESVLMALIALALALSSVEVLLPAYGAFLDRPITFSYITDWPLAVLILAIAVAAGLVSGFYPALVLSGFRPTAVLRTTKSDHVGSTLLRSFLVVTQFAVAIGLAIIAFSVFSQISFARNQSLGFRHDNILIIDTYRRMTAEARKSFADELRHHPGVLDVARSGDIPFSGNQLVAQMMLPGHPEYLTLYRQLITPEYFGLYRMRLVAGRFLSDTRSEDKVASRGPFGNDGRNILINGAAAARFGFTPSGAVGQTVLFGPSRVRIVGVVADAHTDGARIAAKPTVFLSDADDSAFLSVRIAAGRVPETLAFIDRNWRRFAPNVAIDRRFLDESFNKLYLADQRQGDMLAIFVAIAIFIACLGLFGLAAFTAGRRTKEIGIRKVFGARNRDVIRLLLWQFSIPVLLANLIAWPLAWYYLQGWLQTFAYRIDLNPLHFLATGLVALLIAWVTILGHALRIARANPIHALRTE